MSPLVGDQTGAFLVLKCIRFESGTPTLVKATPLLSAPSGLQVGELY